VKENKMAQLSGKTALVTGASSGLGVDFAKCLAEKGTNLVLVARRTDRLETVKADIVNQYGVEVTNISSDLSLPDSPQKLYDQLKAQNKPIDILINNAGLGLYGSFLEIEWAKERQMLEIDILALVHMTKLFVPDMIARGYGYVLQVASIGAFQPSPLYASYSAAKSFVLNFSLAANYEIRKTPVRICTISPGVTKTEFLEVSGQKPTRYQRAMMMDSPTVTRMGIEGMLRGKTNIVPGFLNAVFAWTPRLMPRRMSAMMAERTMRS